MPNKKLNKKARTLTPKQIALVDEYYRTDDYIAAYRHAYNTSANDDTCRTKAVEMLTSEKYPHIKARLADLRDKQSQRIGISKDDIIRELYQVVLDNAALRKEQIIEYTMDGSLADHKIKLNGTSDSIAAAKQISKMLGFDAPVKLEEDTSITINIVKPN
mgnify:CR=1 FL=1